jgi:hypothetical protein
MAGEVLSVKGVQLVLHFLLSNGNKRDLPLFT